MVCVVPLLLQVYVYGGLPPTTSTVAVPSQMPVQEGFVPCVNIVGNGFTVTVSVAVAAHCPVLGVNV